MDDDFILNSTSRANEIFEERKEVIACAFKGRKYIIIKREDEAISMFRNIERMIQQTQQRHSNPLHQYSRHHSNRNFNVECVSQKSLECKNTENLKCSICLQEYVLNEERIFLQCLHCFHKNCIQEWLNHKNECPMCRTFI